ncbi:MAG TPA: homocysteine biosynthesis protein [Methanothrix sp.]|nr:homocysteine biosynthesis protein [Methanothrix sp.]HOV82899.1 homocysteine biosynthesis protein [Methanothrix sp.]HPC89207.1 homocysteine biosynthesis protein [Methanothrix sp.]HQE87126.1 homocysteine biosynthesis protein [Methanothrix sp.]HQI67762.1 homocysteine biosynthesis protein [Methanothrix sp.]
MQEKSLSEINERIRDGSARVVTAEEMPDIVDELGPAEAVREVDVVTTGTFGAMCSSGVFLNLGHSDPPIKIGRAFLNRVEAYGGIAAVDLFLGATQPSEDRGIEYGGAHVMEDLVSGKQIEVDAFGVGTDCYPQTELETCLRLDDFNQAVMVNPRNAYQRYNAATNTSDRTMHTYMGTLLPRVGNIHYSGAGVLSPLSNDPNFDYIGVGTRIFLAGAQGYIMGTGTQHNPQSGFSTLMVTGDMKKMSSRFLRAATFHKYGPSLYLGIGIPIPILNEKLARSTAVRDRDITVPIVDYGIPRRDRPSLKAVSYEDLKSGIIELSGKEVATSSLSSFLMAREVAAMLKQQVEKGEFAITCPVEPLSRLGSSRPMKQTKESPNVGDVMSCDVVTVREDIGVDEAARLIVSGSFDHLPVISKDGRLIGIITTWDISKAVAGGKPSCIGEIMTRRVYSIRADEPIEIAARTFDVHSISAMPVVDRDNKVIGMITSNHLSRLLARRR